MGRIFIIIFLSALSFNSFSQKIPQYPQKYFRWPVDLRPEIVANLGELRTGHWHMGLDVRTNAQVNHKVFATADGFISRIGVAPGGFGRFIMIDHPNGLSTLYAHLNDFFPALEKYVREIQYQRKSWALDIALTPDQFPVKKNDFISFSGTTGGSQGPHVHFEIRDTKTGKCLNPLLFGLPITDVVAPTLVRLAMYDRTKSTYDGSPRFLGLKGSGKNYTLNQMPVLKTGTNKMSFAIQAYDRINGSSNRDGIFSAKVFVDEKLTSGFFLDSIDYVESEYMDAHVDYPYKYNGGAYIQHLSPLPGENSSVYFPKQTDGLIYLNDTAIHDVRIEIGDAHGNLSVLTFKLQWQPSLFKANEKSAFVEEFTPGYVNVFEKEGFEAFFTKLALYDTVKAFYYKNNEPEINAVTDRHQLNTEAIPVQEDMQVRLLATKQLTPAQKDRVLVRQWYRTNKVYKKAAWQQNAKGETWFSAGFDDPGYFAAFLDTMPPTLNAPGKTITLAYGTKQQNLAGIRSLYFTPKDNYKIKSLVAEVDGQWLRFTNDKGRTWIYSFDEHFPAGESSLKVTIEDLAGNITIYNWQVKR